MIKNSSAAITNLSNKLGFYCRKVIQCEVRQDKRQRTSYQVKDTATLHAAYKHCTKCCLACSKNLKVQHLLMFDNISDCSHTVNATITVLSTSSNYEWPQRDVYRRMYSVQCEETGCFEELSLYRCSQDVVLHCFSPKPDTYIVIIRKRKRSSRCPIHIRQAKLVTYTTTKQKK